MQVISKDHGHGLCMIEVFKIKFNEKVKKIMKL